MPHDARFYEAGILLVDDDQDILRLLRHYLASAGFSNVRAVSDSMEALAAFKEFKPDLVVLDLVMQEKDGFEVMEELRALHPDSPLPVIVLSSIRDKGARLMALEGGAQDFILKPFDRTEAVLRIRNFLECRLLHGEIQRRIREMKTEAEGREQDLEAALKERTLEIGKRQGVEEDLEKSREHYELLVRNIPDIVYQIDPDGHFTFVSDSVERILGYRPDELLGRHFSDIIHVEDLGEVSRSLVLREMKGFKIGEEYAPKLFDERRTGRRMTRSLKVRLLPKEGNRRPAQGLRSPFVHAEVDASGCYEDEESRDRFLGTSGIIRDVSVRRELEERLLHSQKLEAIGTLAGGIAHDFNNILSAIMGYSELLKDALPAGGQPRANLEEVLKAGNRAKDLVRQILAFSRRTEEEFIPIRVHLLVKEALKFLRPSLPATIKIEQGIRSSGAILGDPTQIHQVVMNLCTNAYHAMYEKGGVLKLSLRETDVDPESAAMLGGLRPGPCLLLEVADTGHGMDEATRKRIFDPYFTTKGPGRGTGLGLSMVHGIVKAHGGTLFVESEPGKGSVFKVYLPVIREPGEEEGAQEGESPHARGERILFVDDEQAVVRLMEMVLQGMGYAVTAVSGSRKALDLFAENPQSFDLLITDLTMPEMTGEVLAEKVMEIRPDFPVILCTGYSDRIDEKKARAMGIRDYILKPLVMREVHPKIRAVLDAASRKTDPGPKGKAL